MPTSWRPTNPAHSIPPPKPRAGARRQPARGFGEASVASGLEGRNGYSLDLPPENWSTDNGSPLGVSAPPEEDGMRTSRFTEEQIVGILKEQEAGAGTTELCRRHGISAQTFYRWKQKYGGLEGGEARRLKALEEENARLKRLVAEQALDLQIAKDLLRKNW